MIVADASVVVKWLYPRRDIRRRVSSFFEGETFVAPDFVVFETLNVLRRKCKRGEISATQLIQIAGRLHHFFVELVPATGLAQQAVELAIRLDHPVYDCAYLACAIQQATTLVTADDSLFRKAVANSLNPHITLL